jgi:hypothetical protein
MTRKKYTGIFDTARAFHQTAHQTTKNAGNADDQSVADVHPNRCATSGDERRINVDDTFRFLFSNRYLLGW